MDGLSPLRLITPPPDDFKAARFSYPDLELAVKSRFMVQFKTLETDLADSGDSFWREIEPSAAYRYLPVISLKLQQADDEDRQRFWSRQLTLAGIRVFGRPVPSVAAKLVRQQLQQFPAQGGTIVKDIYRSVLRSMVVEPDEDESSDEVLLAAIRQILEKRYRTIYQLIDERFEAVNELGAADIRDVYSRMLDQLKIEDEAWQGWQVVLADSAYMSVSPVQKLIKIGRHLNQLPLNRAKSLFTHEVLVHAARSVRGQTYGSSVAFGMPGYTEAEEGLGVLMEAAIEGQMPYRVVDRYIDISLALGQLGLPAMTRSQLYAMASDRASLRQGSGRFSERATWQHVNRIYKGSLGNDVIGVVPRDVVYYSGYKLMFDYLGRYQARDLYQAVKFALSGKLNPASLEHRHQLHRIKFNIT